VTVVRAVVRDVDHHVAHAYDGDLAPYGEIALGKGGEAIVVIDEVLGVIDAGQPLTLHPEIFRALGAMGEHEGIEAKALQVRDGERSVAAYVHVPDVGDARIAQDLLELASQPALHLVLVEEDAVLGEPARLDVAVEEEDAAARGGEGPGRKEPGGAGPDYRHDAQGVVSHRGGKITNEPASRKRDPPLPLRYAESKPR